MTQNMLLSPHKLRCTLLILRLLTSFVPCRHLTVCVRAIRDMIALCLQVTELKLKVDNVERERDFYFDKLRDIEILCQMPLLQSIPVSLVLAHQRSNIVKKAPCGVMC